MSAAGKWMSPASRTRGARAIARASTGGYFCAKCDQYMTFLDGPPALYQRQSGPTVGGVTDRCQRPYHHVAHVITCGPPLMRYFAPK